MASFFFFKSSFKNLFNNIKYMHKILKNNNIDLNNNGLMKFLNNNELMKFVYIYKYKNVKLNNTLINNINPNIM